MKVTVQPFIVTFWSEKDEFPPKWQFFKTPYIY